MTTCGQGDHKCTSKDQHYFAFIMCLALFFSAICHIGLTEWDSDFGERSGVDLVRQYKKALSAIALSIGGAAGTMMHYKGINYFFGSTEDGTSRYFKFLASFGYSCVVFAVVLMLLSATGGAAGVMESGLGGIMAGAYVGGKLLFLTGLCYFLFRTAPPAESQKDKGSHNLASSGTRVVQGQSSSPVQSTDHQVQDGHGNSGREGSSSRRSAHSSSGRFGYYDSGNGYVPPTERTDRNAYSRDRIDDLVEEIRRQEARSESSFRRTAFDDDQYSGRSSCHERPRGATQQDLVYDDHSRHHRDRNRSSGRSKNNRWIQQRRLKEELPVGNLFLMLAFLILLSLTGYVLHEQCFRKRDTVHSKSIIPMWRPSVTTP